MQAFHIHYRNTQGTLMRILTAVSRRALEMPYVRSEAEPGNQTYKVTLLLEVNPKQVGQLRRDWHAIVDVTEVRITSAEEVTANSEAWSAPHPPSSAVGSDESVRAARA
jgi:acetolactate synthase small subunit